MVTNTRGKDLAIALDPGFDTIKVMINGVYFKIPKEVAEVPPSFNILGEVKEGYYKSYYLDGKEFLIGSQARSLMQQPNMKDKQQHQRNVMDSFDRFTTEEFEVSLVTAVGIALLQYSKVQDKDKYGPKLNFMAGDSEEAWKHNESILKDCNIFIGVALPHDAVRKATPSIKNKLARQHAFAVETVDGYYPLRFSIMENRLITDSQAIVALLGAISDEEGVATDKNNILSKLPALIVDGGYKTVGLYMLSTIQSVENAESNTDYAMGNVHKNVAKMIAERYDRQDIHDFNIPGILEDAHYNGKIVVMDKNGDTDYLNVKNLVDDEVKNICDQLIDYLNEKYGRLLDVRLILVTGGTGAAYYKHLYNYMSQHRKTLDVMLTDSEFDGKKTTPEFAIVIGMYKTMMYHIRRYWEMVNSKN